MAKTHAEMVVKRTAPFTDAEISERIEDNERCVFPDRGYRRWAATVRALQAQLRRSADGDGGET